MLCFTTRAYKTITQHATSSNVSVEKNLVKPLASRENYRFELDENKGEPLELSSSFTSVQFRPHYRNAPPPQQTTTKYIYIPT